MNSREAPILHCGASVGQPIAHSLSPILHNAAYAELGLVGWRYTKHEVPSGGLATFVAGLGPQWVGLSVTMPLKREALAVATEISARASAIGAANTLVFRGNGTVFADNTDAPGMVDAMAEKGLARANNVVILGAGGTAQAALGAAKQLTHNPVILMTRNAARSRDALDTAARLEISVEVHPLESRHLLENADVVMSTVPAGVADQFVGSVPSVGAMVFDVVYDPWPTPFAAAAQAAGCRIVSGLDLLLHQATYQVEHMTGYVAPLEAMRTALLRELRS